MEQTLSRLESQTSMTRDRLSSTAEELDLQAAKVAELQQEVAGLHTQLGDAEAARQNLEDQVAGWQLARVGQLVWERCTHISHVCAPAGSNPRQ